MWHPERREPRPGRPRGRSSATRGGGWGLRTIERLEARGLLTVTINPITPIAEIPFNDQVATFTSPPTGVTFTATIGWGDGSPPTIGAVQPDSHGNLDISGSHTYQLAGQVAVSVMLQGSDGSTFTGGPTFETVASPFSNGVGQNFTVSAGQTFPTRKIATFSDINPAPVGLQATIDWGDGSPSTIGTVVKDGPTEYEVDGSHTYTSASFSPNPTTTTVFDAPGNQLQISGSAFVSQAALQATAIPISATADQPLSDVEVARFTDSQGDTNGADFTATINWGDGSPTDTVIPIADPAGGFDVLGSHTYAVAGTDETVIKVTRSSNGDTATAVGTATVTKASLVSQVLTPASTVVIASAGVPLTNVPVGSFTDSFAQALPSSYNAVINWGDGHVSAGMVEPGPEGTFLIVGSNAYALPGTYPIAAVASDLLGHSVTINSTAVVASPVIPFTAGLAPSSQTGNAAGAAITNEIRPTFSGTAEPFSIVQIFGRLPGQLGPVSLGEAPAGPDGVWSVTAPSLAQGIYAMSSMVISPSGVVGPMTAFTASGGFVTVDYTPPQVVSLTYNRNTGQLTAIFADNLSGMDVASMVNPLNYTLIFGPVSRRGPSTVTPIPTVASIPTDPEGVVVSFAINSRLRSALKAVRLISGGVRDLAGNTLAAEELVPVNAKPARRPRRR